MADEVRLPAVVHIAARDGMIAHQEVLPLEGSRNRRTLEVLFRQQPAISYTCTTGPEPPHYQGAVYGATRDFQAFPDRSISRPGRSHLNRETSPDCSKPRLRPLGCFPFCDANPRFQAGNSDPN